ncbi:MAG: phage major capsid protein [Legionellales bacterium]
MAQNLSNFDAVLKDYYEGHVRSVLNNDVKLLKLLQKDTSSWSGRQIIFPVNVGRNFGVGARADGGTLPAAQFQRYVKSTISAINMYGHIEITGPTMVAARDDKGAFTRATSSEVENMMNDLKIHMNILFFGNGSGKYAGVTDNSSNYPTTVGNVNVDTTRFIRVNMVLDVISTLGVYKDTLTVTAVNSATQIAVTGTTGSVSKVNTDYLVITGDNGNDPMGLHGIVDDGGDVGTLQGISRSAQQGWQANVLSASSNRNLDLDLMQRGVDIALENGGGNIDHILSHLGVRREYINLLTPDVRFEPLQLQGGYKTLEFNGITFDFDRHCQYNTVYMLNKASLRMYIQQDFKWADEDGSILRAAAVGASAKDSFEAFMRWIGNLGASEGPNKMTRIDKINQVIETNILAS